LIFSPLFHQGKRGKKTAKHIGKVTKE